MEEQQDDYTPAIADLIESIIEVDRAERVPPVGKAIFDVPQTIGEIGGPNALIRAIPRSEPVVDPLGTSPDITPLAVQDEGSEVEDDTRTINFAGDGVEVTAGPGAGGTTVTIAGGSDTTVPTNSGSGEGLVLKTGTNVVARSLRQKSDGGITITQNEDEIEFSITEESTVTEATYILVFVEIGGTLSAHKVTLRGVDLGEFVE